MNALRTLVLAGLVAAAVPVPAHAAAGSGAAAGTSAAVTTAMPQRQTFSATVTGYGSIMADPRAARALSLPAAGRVMQVLTTPGARVTAGQVLLRLQADPASRLAYVLAQHDLQLAQTLLQQTQTLYEERLATQAQLDTARKSAADAQANLATQRALGLDGSGLEVKATSAGVVQSVEVTTGERVAAGATLLRLAPARQTLARVGVEPGVAARLKPHQSVTLTPVFGGTALRGQVAEIGNLLDPQTRLVEILVTLPESSVLTLGSSVAAQIDTGSTNAWAVPRTAVLTDEHGAYLFQIDQGIAHRIAVNLVQPDGDTVGVAGPLDPRRPVVVLGAYELTDGMQVRIQQP